MKIRYRKHNRGVLGSIEIPTTAPGAIVATAHGADIADALARAAAIAARIADDPVMAVLMPGETLDRLDDVRDLARAAQDGPEALREAWADIPPSRSKQALCAVLHKEANARRVEGGAWIPSYAHGQMRVVDVVDGDGVEVAGFWDSVTDIAKKGADLAYQQAMAHKKEIAMAAATAAFGPAGGIAAGKAMDLVNAAQAGDPAAKKAVAQVAQKAAQGNPRARVMMSVIKREVAAPVNRDQRGDGAPAVTYSPGDDNGGTDDGDGGADDVDDGAPTTAAEVDEARAGASETRMH